LEERPSTAITLSIIGGILIIVGSALMFFTVMYGWVGHGMMGSFGEMMGPIGGMVGGYMDMLGNFGIPSSFMGGLSLVGLICGLLIVVGALMINANPAEHNTWGIVILVFSIISFLGTAGFYIGAILGIIGGALAITWKE
jgi:hypothetical protein